MSPARPFLLSLLALTVAGPAAARPCDEDDLELIETLLGELEQWGVSATWGSGSEPDDELLALVAAEGGCEWTPEQGDPTDDLERLRWRVSLDATPDDLRRPADGFEPWWRIFLPRVELRWVGRYLQGAASVGGSEAREARFELWLLWNLLPVR